MSKYGLDKFYTKKEIAKKLIEKIDLSEFNLIIEPAAGNGSFSNLINNVKAFDIEPEGFNIKKADFLKINPKEFSGNTLVIGNPPFGRNGSLALSFIKHSCLFCEKFAFILPMSFKKQSFYDKIPMNFWKIYEEDLPENSFIFEGKEINIPCVFQIYEKREELRIKKKIEQPDWFSFVKKEEANLSIRRVGIYAGKAFLDIDKSEQSHYFIKTENPIDFVDMINSIKWEHNNTVGPRSISKLELLEKIT